MKKRNSWQIGITAGFWLLLCPKFLMIGNGNDGNLLLMLAMLAGVILLIGLSCLVLSHFLGDEIHLSSRKWRTFLWLVLLISIVGLNVMFFTVNPWIILALYAVEFLWVCWYFRD